jgi:hypothetical protein
MFIRRDGNGFNRFTWLRVALFFLAAGIWLGGALSGNDLATGAAIVVLLAAVVLGRVGARKR